MAGPRISTRATIRQTGIPSGLTFAIFCLLAGCDASPQAAEDLNRAFTADLPDPVVVPAPEPSVGCYADRYTQPAADVTKKVDLLIMTDSSSSLDDERQKVSDGIDAFIRALPVDVDFRIATMLAHGGGSSWAGRIYSKYRTGAAKVLRSDTLTRDQIRSGLRDDLMHVVSDNGSDGGEIGTYSMTRAMDDDRLAESRGLGFFRDDAALAVIFISDENDICAMFPAGYTPVPDPQGSEARAKSLYCTRTAPAHTANGVVITPSYTEHISAESVVRKLQDLQGGRPLVVSAIAYTDKVNYPHVGENEYGYGWLDMVELANGVKVEMTDASYDSGLNQIGALTAVKLSLNKEFALTHRGIDASTISAKVDGQPVTFTYIPELNQVSLDSLGSALSTVDLAYCDPRPEPSPSPSPAPSPTPTGVAGVDNLCSSGAFVPKASLVAGISIDPAEGSSATILSGLGAMGITPIQYTDAEIAGGKPMADGVTVLVLSRKVVVSPVNAAYVAGIRSFVAGGGSLLAEYDGAAMLFDRYDGLNVSFTGHFSPSVGLFSGNVAGGGLLLPLSFSSAFVIDTGHPIMMGVPTTLSTGLRAAFAVTDYPSTWLAPLATFSASGSTGSIPAGTFPAVLAGRCGGGRVALFPMNHFSVLSNAGVATMVQNAFDWLIGQ
ncbi:MAG: hypothetical protein JST04_07760 [Bdellovibrionales bacterium]|nr:hypothetical protein [Bdellovibrionales bacterium]